MIHKYQETNQPIQFTRNVWISEKKQTLWWPIASAGRKPPLRIGKDFVQNAKTTNLLNIFWILQVHSVFTRLTKIFLYLLAQRNICAFITIRINYTSSFCPISKRTCLFYFILFLFSLVYTISQTTCWTCSPNTRTTVYNTRVHNEQ